MRALALLLLLALPLTVKAANPESLREYLARTSSAKATFEQTVIDRNGKVLQRASGTMAFSRPGKFRWEYDKPYQQTIVGDGQRLWIYDKDLNQVTVRSLDRALGASPAAILAGSNEIDRNYIVASAGSRDGLDWLEAVPRTKDTAFERMRLGFGRNGLEAMELHDQFGQTTLIRFGDLERNPKLPAKLFTFTPPQGADVISD